AVVLFILFVAILNLALGYGLAVYLHGWSVLPNGWSLPVRLKAISLSKDADDETEESSASSRADRDASVQTQLPDGTMTRGASQTASASSKKPAEVSSAAIVADDDFAAGSSTIDEEETGATAAAGARR
ncbi:MAG TPA: hypothetical protein VKB78_10680, partial [Pirellulales bacterium]|nr:hypothetical protein [Pirellulales bacterium]